MNSQDASAYGVYDAAWNNSGDATVVLLSIAATTKVSRLPADWGTGGFWVHLCSPSVAVVYRLSSHADAEVAVIAGTDGGATDETAGDYLPSGIKEPVKVPDGCVYLTRIAADETSTGTLYVALRSDPMK